MAASILLGIEAGQIGVERALSDPEDVGTLAAHVVPRDQTNPIGADIEVIAG